VDRRRSPGPVPAHRLGQCAAGPEAVGSLAGRMEILRLHPLSESQIESFINEALPINVKG
jgi:hypothetical protein